MKLITFGWTNFIDENDFKAKIGKGPVSKLVLHSGKNEMGLEDMVMFIKDFHPDYVVLDADVFREMADRVEATRLKK